MPTIIPPIIPAIRPENSGAPLAKAIPKQSGSATKNTTILAGMSLFKFENKVEFFISILSKYFNYINRYGYLWRAKIKKNLFIVKFIAFFTNN